MTHAQTERMTTRAPRLGHRGQWRPRRRIPEPPSVLAMPTRQDGRTRPGERPHPGSPTLT